MYEGNKLYSQYKEEKDELENHLPEWISILQDYFRKSYDNNPSNKFTPEKNKKKGVEKLL